MSRVFRSTVVAAAFTFLASVVSAELGRQEGVTHISKLPETTISKSATFLAVPHISQGIKPWCVPVSAAMVLEYYGIKVSPAKLKESAENHKPEALRNADFTYWADMKIALKTQGQRWDIKNYAKSAQGFRQGMREIRASLRRARPVLIEVHLREGHTFVVVGFNDTEKLLYVRDPLLRKDQIRVLSYETLRANWHNHRFHNSRSAFFSKPPS